MLLMILGTARYTAGGRSFDLPAAISSVTRPGAVRSWATTVATPAAEGRPAGNVAGRVCVLRKSAEAIRLAHQKIRRDAARKGNQVQPATLRFAFSAPDALEWYRLCWQVELGFQALQFAGPVGAPAEVRRRQR